MPKPHMPVIRRPTPEELDDAIAHAESKGWYGLVGALKDYKRLRQIVFESDPGNDPCNWPENIR